jgi:hypothetical protein
MSQSLFSDFDRSPGEIFGLEQWYFKEGVEHVSALKVWQDSCHYLYLPRLINSDVLNQTIIAGITSKDFFGFAVQATEEGYLGFAFGRTALVNLDQDSVLISLTAAEKHRAKLDEQAAQQEADAGESGSGGSQATGSSEAQSEDAGRGAAGVAAASGREGEVRLPTQFYGTMNLDPVMAAMDFSKVVEEVVQHFSSQMGVEVTINVEINAKSSTGFDQSIQRTIKENCSVLRFNTAEFED